MTGLHKASTLTIIVSLLLILLFVGCKAEDNVPADAIATNEEAVEVMGYGGEDSTPYFGLITMEELVLHSKAIARVRFNSAEQGIEHMRWTWDDGYQIEQYAGAVVITFDVLEYLKGSGSQQIEVVLHDNDVMRYTRAEIEALNEDLLSLRDTQWDDREAIVFLQSGNPMLSTVNDSDRYYMVAFRAAGELAYTVDSRWSKGWLPAAASGQASGRSGDAQRFLTNVSSGDGATRQAGNQTETMTLGDIKAFIKAVEDEVDAGGGTDAYRACIQRKNSWANDVADYKAWIEGQGRDYFEQFDKQIESSNPAGTEVYEGGNVLLLSEADKATAPSNANDLVVISGQDANLFEHTWPLLATTARPLPEGEYRFYWAEQGDIEALCDAMPEDYKTRYEVVVTVTPHPNTLHEAFFDPVTVGTGVGADSSNGVIKPTSFTVDGTSTSITGLKWESGSVVLSLSPYSSLSGHKLDFIELDGSIGLSLETSSATGDTTAGTLTWTVTDQPWHDGDTLMLRISPSSLTPSAAPDTPQTPTGQAIGSRTVSLDWADVPGASSYRIRFWRGTAGWLILPAESITLDFDGSSVTISGLPDRRLHTFSIQAVNAVGSSGWSGAATVGQGI